MVKVIKAPNRFQSELGRSPSVFLAGSIDMGEAKDWQMTVTQALGDRDVLVLNPRRDDWDSSLKQDISNPQFARQVNWEMDAMDVADLIIFYFDPEGKAPVTLMELGLHVGDNILVCCPEGYWRRGNVQVVCSRNGVDVLDSLDDLIAALIEQVDA